MFNLNYETNNFDAGLPSSNETNGLSPFLEFKTRTHRYNLLKIHLLSAPSVPRSSFVIRYCSYVDASTAMAIAMATPWRNDNDHDNDHENDQLYAYDYDLLIKLCYDL